MNAYKLLRVLKDRKIRELADDLMVTPAFVSAVELGKREPSRRLKRDYLDYFAISEENFNNLNQTLESGSLGYNEIIEKILR